MAVNYNVDPFFHEVISSPCLVPGKMKRVKAYSEDGILTFGKSSPFIHCGLKSASDEKLLHFLEKYLEELNNDTETVQKLGQNPTQVYDFTKKITGIISEKNLHKSKKTGETAARVTRLCETLSFLVKTLIDKSAEFAQNTSLAVSENVVGSQAARNACTIIANNDFVTNYLQENIEAYEPQIRQFLKDCQCDDFIIRQGSYNEAQLKKINGVKSRIIADAGVRLIRNAAGSPEKRAAALQGAVQGAITGPFVAFNAIRHKDYERDSENYLTDVAIAELYKDVLEVIKKNHTSTLGSRVENGVQTITRNAVAGATVACVAVKVDDFVQGTCNYVRSEVETVKKDLYDLKAYLEELWASRFPTENGFVA